MDGKAQKTIVKHPFGIRAFRDKGKILVALGKMPGRTSQLHGSSMAGEDARRYLVDDD